MASDGKNSMVGAAKPAPRGDAGADPRTVSSRSSASEPETRGGHGAPLRSMFGKDISYLVASTVQMAVSFLLTPVQTRVLHAAGYGQLSLGIALTQVASVALCLGLHTAAQRTYHERGGPEHARKLLTLVTASAMVCGAGLYVSAGSWAPYIDRAPHHTAIMGEVVAWAAMTGVTVFCMALLRSAERPALYWTLALLQGLMAPLLAVILAVDASGSVSVYIDGLVIGQAVAMCLGVGAIRPQLPGRGELPTMVRDLRFGVLLVPQQVSSALLSMGDRLVIQRLLGSVANGRYSAAYSVGSMGIMAASMLSAAWLPRVFALRAGETESGILSALRDHMELLAAVVTLGICVGAPVLLDVWLPRGFDPSGLRMVTGIVTVSMIPYVWFLSELWILLRSGRSGALAVVTVVAAGANLGLNVWLVPHLGIEGAAVATAGSYALLAVLTRWMAGWAAVYRARPVSLWLVTVVGIGGSIGSAYLPSGGDWLAARLMTVVCCLAIVGMVVRRAREEPGTLIDPGLLS